MSWGKYGKLEIDDNLKEQRVETCTEALQKWWEFEDAGNELKDKCIGETNQPRPQPLQVWETPPEGVIRMNSDAAVSAQMIRTGLRIMARD